MRIKLSVNLKQSSLYARRMRGIKSLFKIKLPKQQRTLFLLVLLTIVFAFMLHLFVSYKVLLKSQEKIKECHTEHLQKAYTLFFSSLAGISDVFDSPFFNGVYL